MTVDAHVLAAETGANLGLEPVRTGFTRQRDEFRGIAARDLGEDGGQVHLRDQGVGNLAGRRLAGPAGDEGDPNATISEVTSLDFKISPDVTLVCHST